MRVTDALLERRATLEYFQPGLRAISDNDSYFTELIRDLVEIVNECETYYVSADMTAVAEAAARTMPEQVLRRDDLPSERGFLLYDRPVGEVAYEDGPVAVRGFAWLTSGEVSVIEHTPECSLVTGPECGNCPGDSVKCKYYDDLTEEEIAGHPPCRRGLCPCAGSTGQGIPTGRTPQVKVYPLGNLPGIPCLTVLIHSAEAYGYPKWPVGAIPLDDDDGLCRTLLATWTIMQQAISVSVRIPADRPERRRCARIGLPQDVLVVRLRRRSLDDDSADPTESGTVEWSHRWLVSGHWRNQWLPSRASHRVQWIAGYIKGPTEKPLVIKDRVTAWIR